jgi:hypothetical protein
LDLVTCGDSFEEAKANFSEALSLFFEECLNNDSLDSVLLSCGFQKQQIKTNISSGNSKQTPVFSLVEKVRGLYVFRG